MPFQDGTRMVHQLIVILLKSFGVMTLVIVDQKR